MKKNLGISDRIIRFVIVDLLLGLSFLGFEIQPIWYTLAFVLSIWLAITVIFGYSPLYHLFKISTRDKKQVSSSEPIEGSHPENY